MFIEENGVFYIRIEGRFESAHYLYNYFPDGSNEPIHGHSWKIEVYIAGLKNIRPDGISFDFLDAKQRLKKLLDSIDHILINEHPDFTNINPTSENIAKWFYHNLKDNVANQEGKIKKIAIYEGPENIAFFEPSSF